ncbi:MAG: YcgL domain-containing protein [Thiothrix sp.]|nr:YcgL domain-containing protein [Thiothrix sp.]HPQ96442.1 YcgL domain-containing protein [Thiolinea sp.]
MLCYVYRSRHKPFTYLLLPEKDNFSRVPLSLIELFGEAVFSFEFELTTERSLVQADPVQVIANMQQNGFFLQLPPGKETHLVS